MKQIIVKKRFLHCVKLAIYPTEFLPLGEPIEVDDETAEIAIREGWADPLATSQGEPGHPSPGSGKAKPSVSSQVGPASPKGKPARSKGKREPS